MLRVTQIDGLGCGLEMAQYAGRSPNSLLYTDWRYLDLVSDHLDASISWLVASRDVGIVGFLPFMRRDGPLGPVFNSLPFYGSNGGVVQAAPDLEAKEVLITAFYAAAEEAGACSATIITNPLMGDADFYERHAKAMFRDERIGQITHLPEDPGLLMAMFSDPRPRNIRRALKAGVHIDARQDDAAIRFLFEVHQANMQAIGGLAKRWPFFAAINDKMGKESWKVYVASINGAPVGGLLLFYHNKTVEYFTPAIIEEHRNAQPLALAIYQAMVDAIKAGYTNWNWGGTWTMQGGVYDFKRRWGTSEYRYYYYVRLFNDAVRHETPESLLTHYPGFYLIPFNSLK